MIIAATIPPSPACIKQRSRLNYGKLKPLLIGMGFGFVFFDFLSDIGRLVIFQNLALLLYSMDICQ